VNLLAQLSLRTATVLPRALFDLAVPIAIAFAVVTFLADPQHIATGEIRANSLLMSSRPIFRVIAPGDELRVALGSSAILLCVAMAIAIAVGLPAGIAYAWSRNRLVKPLVWSFTTLAAALPAFFWAVSLELVMTFLFLQYGFRVVPIAGFGIDEHLILPSLALAIRPAAYVFRLTAIAIEEVGHADYVRTGRAKGLGDRPLLLRHVLPNATPQIIGAIVIAIRGALSSLLIVEFVYVWGGAGLMFVQALGERRLMLASELAISFAIGSAVLTVIADAARRRVRVRT
jgi:ABC-type dipeptide/oligopeptide/nickel transport system permease component